MKKIKLTQGKYVIVDDEDYDYLNQFKWHYGGGYARRAKRRDNQLQFIYMHRVVNKTPKGMYTDHINQDKLDNRKGNLRTCTNQQNQYNSKMRKDNKSGYKGVSWYNPLKKWVAHVRVDGTPKHLGYFDTPEEASSEYQNKAKEFYGEYC